MSTRHALVVHTETQIQMTPKHIKRPSASYTIRRMHAYSKYNRIPIFAYRIGNNPNVSAVVRNRPIESNWQYLSELQIHTPFDSTVLLLGICPDLQPPDWEVTWGGCIPIPALFVIANGWNPFRSLPRRNQVSQDTPSRGSYQK